MRELVLLYMSSSKYRLTSNNLLNFIKKNPGKMVNSGENIFSETPGNFHINFPGMFFGGGGRGVERVLIRHTN